MKNVVVVDFPGLDPEVGKSLWVRDGYSAYKSAYVDFLTEHHGCPNKLPMAKLGYDIDHLQNRARVAKGTFIRVEATPSMPQQHWGRTYEKWASHSTFRKKPMASASWVIIYKLCGMNPPEDWQDAGWFIGLQKFIDDNNIIDFDNGHRRRALAEIARVYLPRKRDAGKLSAHLAQAEAEEAAAHPGVPHFSDLASQILSQSDAWLADGSESEKLKSLTDSMWGPQKRPTIE